MYDGLSFAEIVGQHLELLPARTVLSAFHGGAGGDGALGFGGDGGDGGDAEVEDNCNEGYYQVNIADGGDGGHGGEGEGGDADGGDGGGDGGE